MIDFNKVINDPWLENIVLASLPFYKYENGCLVANASGCLVEVNGKKFLLSISHSNLTGPNWTVETKSNLGNGNIGQFLLVDRMKPLAQIKFDSSLFDSSKTKIVDFTYCMVNNQFITYHTLRINNTQELIAERTVFKIERNYSPNKNLKYGFFGHINFKKNDCKPTYDFRLESNLKFVDEKDEFYVFELDHNYGSHYNYLGCSGAPIIDENNNLAALVSFGNRKKNLIYGIKIRDYMSALIIDTI